MDKKDFCVGQKVVFLVIEGSNTYRYLREEYRDNPDKRILNATVTSVGRKYISAVRDNIVGEIKFDITNDFIEYNGYSSNYKLFLTKTDALKYLEGNKLYEEIRKELFSYGNKKPSYEKLLAIYKVLFENNCPYEVKEEQGD